MKYDPKLNFSETLNRKSWVTESYAFSKSIASKIPELFVIPKLSSVVYTASNTDLHPTYFLNAALFLFVNF